MPKLPFSFPDVVRYPLHAVVYLLLAYFVYKEFTKKDECKDLNSTIEELRKVNTAQAKRINDVEKRNDDLVWAVAVKSGVINQLKSKKDSIYKDSNENIN